MNNNDIQVSVCIVTYNQESYIAECIESIVTQQTNFKFEIIIGEDCSSDNTRAIVQQYAEKYPDLIIPVFHKKNVGVVENIKQIYEKARGKYIAHLDGDDLALPSKLQKQFDVMEKNPQAIFCSHDMLEILNHRIVEKRSWNYPEGEYTILDLIKNLPFFAHSSKLFRVIDNCDLSNVLKDANTLDIEIHLYQATMGSILHLEEELGCYRHNVGVTALKDNKLNSILIERVLAIYETLLIDYPNFEKEIKKAYSKHLLKLAYSYAVFESNSEKMKKYIVSSIKNDFFSINQIFMLSLSMVPSIGIHILKLRKRIRN